MSPIGTASCTELVLCHRTGQPPEGTGHQLAVISYRREGGKEGVEENLATTTLTAGEKSNVQILAEISLGFFEALNEGLRAPRPRKSDPTYFAALLRLRP